MANLVPQSSFDDVYQIALTDDVLGGAGGAPNAQAQNLLNRTQWLKDNTYEKTEVYTQTEINAIESGLQGDIDDNADDIAANLAQIGINTGNITTHTSQIAALDLRITENENDIGDLENKDADLSGRLDVLEDDTGWLNGNRTSSKVDVATFICKVRQIGGIIYVTGRIKLNSTPTIGEVLITYPNNIGYPSQKWYFFSGDSENDKVNQLEIYNANRFIRADSANMAVGKTHSFATSYPADF